MPLLAFRPGDPDELDQLFPRTQGGVEHGHITLLAGDLMGATLDLTVTISYRAAEVDWRLQGEVVKARDLLSVSALEDRFQKCLERLRMDVLTIGMLASDLSIQLARARRDLVHSVVDLQVDGNVALAPTHELAVDWAQRLNREFSTYARPSAYASRLP